MKVYYLMLCKNRYTDQYQVVRSRRQGYSPTGWECLGVLGYFERPDPDADIQ